MQKTVFKRVSQEHSMGCSVACVASRCRISYQEGLELFSYPQKAWTVGYYCKDVVRALDRFGLKYSFGAFRENGFEDILKKEGTIVFVDPCTEYPAGHYLVRSRSGWMNPWANYPQMIPVESKFQKSLPGRVGWVIYEVH